ncbi:MAG: hypothetical protein ACREPG_00215 [Candidatus Binatia bacterium]
MKAKFFFAVFLAAVFGVVYAEAGGASGGVGGGAGSPCGGVGGPGCSGGAGGAGGSVGPITNNNTNVNVNSNSQGQSQHQQQHQQQYQGQGQGQSQSTTANVGNTQGVTINNNVPKQTPAGPGIASSPSANCRIAIGASVGVVGFSGGAFGSVLDEECRKHEHIRMLREVLGRPDAAKKLACSDAVLAEALGDCPAAKKADTPGPVRSAAVEQPRNCTSDPFIAARTGAVLCK